MKGKYVGLLLSVVVGMLLTQASCGHDRELISITVLPDGATIKGAGTEVDFKAVGTYVHPPEQRDITNSVVWQSAAPQVISIDANTGVATAGTGCGTNITITATAYSNPQNKSGSVVVGTAAITVTCPG